MADALTAESKPLCWDAAAQDYLEHRPGYPPQYFELLQHLGIGLRGQDILDLGTGTGALSIPFARQGACVTGVDPSEGQIRAARRSAEGRGVNIDFKIAHAEETGLPDHSFDAITASMCWAYFDIHRMEVEVPRLMRPEGLLLTSTLIWTRRGNPIASQTEELIGRYNSEANRKDDGKHAKIVPEWSENRFRLKTYHHFVVDVPFTRESWRGRIRACKWIGASLPAELTQAFDREHAALLERIAPPQFNIPHDIRIHIFEVQH